MSKSNVTERNEEKEIGSLLQLFVWRLPKKNHDAMVQFEKQINDLFWKHGTQPPKIFQLNSTKTSENMGFTNIANTVSANQDEEVWVELHSYIDHKQLDDVSAKMEKDESAGQLYKQFMDLITPESCIEGQFSRISV
jgi:uncharacterized protein YbaA (DUF1428 family)